MIRSLVAIDGRDVQRPMQLDCDVAVVGSGPAGAAVARVLAASGADVVVLEEGRHHPPASFAEDGFSAMADMYRDLGASLMLGRAPMPFVQARAVGGTSVVNGAISWRLPEDVYRGWVAADPAVGEALPWESVSAALDTIERDLEIAPTAPDIAGPNNLLLARGAEALGLDHRPIERNVRGCLGLGRCLQGCPAGRKLSMDRSLLPEAVAHGARIVASTRVTRVVVEHGRARGVAGLAAGGGPVRVRARRAVVVCASAVQSPALLLRSGIRHGPVGRNFQCHPGVSVAGFFDEPVRMWTGATQGHEVTGLRLEGLKFEALGYDMAITGLRLKGVGSSLARGIADLAHWANWGAAIRAEARGRIRPGRRRVGVRYGLTRADVAKVRRGVEVLCRLFFAAGAKRVQPGVHGWHVELTDPGPLDAFDSQAPWDTRCYSAAATHLFGTCRLGSRPAESVVRPDFRHHTVDRLYVADSSVFPTNTGVNPQTSILALASLCGEEIRKK